MSASVRCDGAQRGERTGDHPRIRGHAPPGHALAREEEDVMTGADVLDVARDAIMTLVIVSSPLMIVGLVVGVVISLFQALTQIQEMTLVFVPKIIAIFIAMLIALPFMADVLQGQMTRIAARIASGG
jgi:flagellar biosynthetic protein FliQ